MPLVQLNDESASWTVLINEQDISCRAPLAGLPLVDHLLTRYARSLVINYRQPFI